MLHVTCFERACMGHALTSLLTFTYVIHLTKEIMFVLGGGGGGGGEGV